MTKATDTNSRHWAVAVFLQIGIRIRYLFESWFFLKPFILPLSAYPSPLRPKNAPHYDFVTQIGFKLLWLSVASMRNWMLPYLFVCQTGLISVFNYIQTLLANRLIAQMEAAGYSEADREVQIPEFDWKKGDPEVFYKTYVAKPHPVVLRGFMKDTKLLKELNWDKVLSQFGEEEVMLTKKEIDGYPGKLKQGK